ncbi:MAG: mercuric reductase [Gemmatimonadales bacterium]|nr:MAG: mercuric reductase [Gemmatimonadales bacterium]
MITDTPTESLVRPLDDHNLRLLSEVHPPGWTNPEPASRYDLVVVGGGSGGLVSSAIGAAVGGRVALVERGLLGGDCLNSGCVPSKAVLRSASAWAGARRAREAFHGPEASGDGDFAAVMERMRRIRADISPADSAARFTELGSDVFLGSGRFTGPDRLEVEGDDGSTRTLEFRRAIIATGGRPFLPPVPGLDTTPDVLTSESIFWLESRPETLLVLGAGAIGCELAQAFARLGSRVVLLEAGDRIMGRDDPDAAPLVQASLEVDGVEVRTGAAVAGVESRDSDGSGVRATVGSGEALEADALLVAAGRVPNTEGLGLEAAGVEADRSGVKVDDRLRTTNRRIWAVGDVVPGPRFTHAADAEARIAVPNALFFGRGRRSKLVIPRCTYTDPEVAHVGIEPHEVAARGEDVRTLTLSFEDVDRAITEGAVEGFARVHLKAGTDTILGATIVGAGAGDLIAPLSVAMNEGMGLSAFGNAVYPYPTRAEVLRKLADLKRRDALTPRTRGIMARVLGFLRRF